MRQKRDPVPRARDAWVWLGGLALLGFLGAGVTAGAIVLWENIDMRQLVPQLAAPLPEIPRPEPVRPPARADAPFDAVIFRSERNEEYFPDATYYRDALDAWGALIRESGGTVREVTNPAGLRSIDSDAVLVLVEAPCLSDAELTAVRAHLRRGGGLVANWALGARDERCDWVGWQVVSELTGAEDVREILDREALYLAVPSAVSLAPGFDPGTRIELRPDPSLALRLPGARVYWSDWALNPAPDESGGGADVAAIATRSPLGGRIAWFGLRLGQGATLDDSALLGRLVQNGVSWAAGLALAAPAAWPGANRAALVFTLDVEDQPRNAVDMAAFLRERGLPGTFFAVSQLVLDDSELGSALIRAGEVGSQTSDHAPLTGLTAQDQRIRVRRSASEIEAWVGEPPLGLRPPEETFDRNTLDAWQRAGGAYLLASNEARSASPEIHAVGEGSMVVLPRIIKDDYNIIVQDRVLRATTLGDAYLAGTRKVRAIGGLAVVAGHTQIMREGPRIRALGTLADTIAAQGDWWVARASAVAAWWSARAATDVAFAAAAPDSGRGPQGPVPDLTVTTPVAAGMDELWVDVVLPTGPERLAPSVDGVPVDFIETVWGMRVPVGPVTAGASRTVTFTPLGPDEARPAP